MRRHEYQALAPAHRLLDVLPAVGCRQDAVDFGGRFRWQGCEVTHVADVVAPLLASNSCDVCLRIRYAADVIRYPGVHCWQHAPANLRYEVREQQLDLQWQHSRQPAG